MDSKKLRETARKLRAKSETETSASFLPDEACNGSLELIGLSESLKTDSRNEVCLFGIGPISLLTYSSFTKMLSCSKHGFDLHH